MYCLTKASISIEVVGGFLGEDLGDILLDGCSRDILLPTAIVLAMSMFAAMRNLLCEYIGD